MTGRVHEPIDEAVPNDILSRLVRIFLESNLSIILILVSLLLGLAALLVTPREEDPQIVVPLADIFVQFPGHSAAEVEQLVATPLERMLYQLDGVEYVYSMSRDDQAVITVRFLVGEDRERSLVKLFKKLQENLDRIPPGVASWVLKPVEIDDVPVVNLTLTSGSSGSDQLRRVAEELVERLSIVPKVSRAYVVGGEPRIVEVQLNADRLAAYELSPLEVARALRAANVTLPAGTFARDNQTVVVEAGLELTSIEQIGRLVVGIAQEAPIYLKDVAELRDGPDEATTYVRHGWGPARNFPIHHGGVGTRIGVIREHESETPESAVTSDAGPLSSQPAVTIAVSKQQGSNAVRVAADVLKLAEELQRTVVPGDIDMIVTRNYGLTADEKVSELIEALGVAILIVILLLMLSMGWREAFVVAVAVPVVFGLTLAVNLLFGYTVNRVTLFALILSLGLLVDDPIVDVENIARHFHERRKATRGIVLQAVAEIRPPLISATLAVIVSFLPLFFITGMMGPYMSPMALNVPVAMFMSMVVAFTITPWLSYHVLRGEYPESDGEVAKGEERSDRATGVHALYDVESVRQTLLYRIFRPLMAPLLRTKWRAIGFLVGMAALTVAAAWLAVVRWVPLKMLPFDNKNELLIVLDMPEGTPVEQTNAAVLDFEQFLATVPEAVNYVSYIGTASPIDFNGLVRHYYLRQRGHQAEIRLNLVGKKNRSLQSHAVALRLRPELVSLARRHGAALQIVELPPGPPVLASLVAEVYGRSDSSYQELLDAATLVANRMRREPGVVDVDEIREAAARKVVFQVDQEKAALAGINVADLAETVRIGVEGDSSLALRQDAERNSLKIVTRLPRADRSHLPSLAQIQIKGAGGASVPLSELGTWREDSAGQTIYHKNLQRVAYVWAETAGRPPAECVVDIQADQLPAGSPVPKSADEQPRSVATRTYLHPGGGVAWSIPAGMEVRFAGEGEWKITLDVFRDLGLAFGAAMLMIYVILVAQTGSFVVPIIVMLAIPLTVLGVMPGFMLLNLWTGQQIGPYADPVYFTATAMIGMIALAGIVTRDSIILVDFTNLAHQAGRPLFDAILESRVVRLRPILLTAGAALLSSIPITFDPIFSGLGWSLIFGLLASTVFTLFVIPVTYWLTHHRSPLRNEQ